MPEAHCRLVIQAMSCDTAGMEQEQVIVGSISGSHHPASSGASAGVGGGVKVGGEGEGEWRGLAEHRANSAE